MSLINVDDIYYNNHEKVDGELSTDPDYVDSLNEFTVIMNQIKESVSHDTYFQLDAVVGKLLEAEGRVCYVEGFCEGAIRTKAIIEMKK